MRTTPINAYSVSSLDLELKAVESLIKDCLEVAGGLPSRNRMSEKMKKLAQETVNSLNQAKAIRERLLLHRFLLSDLSAN